MPCQASDSEKKIQKQNVRYGVHKCTVSSSNKKKKVKGLFIVEIALSLSS